jgi:hypothetical protein
MKRYINWFLEGKLLYLFLFLFLFVLLLDRINLGYKTEDNIRFYGLFLQLIGSILLVYSLRDKLILFKGLGLIDFFKDYFKRFPINKAHKILDIQGSSHSHSTVSGDLRTVVRPKEDLKDIIRYVDEEFEYLQKRLAKLKNELKSDVNKIKRELSESKYKISQELQDTKMLISDSSVSNIWLDMFGIFTILTGIIYATIPDIIEKLIFQCIL